MLLIYSMLYYSIFLFLAFYYTKPKELGFRKTDLIIDIVYALLFLSLMLLATLIIGIIGHLVGMENDMNKVSEVIKTSIPEYLIITVVVGSIVEEIFFRGFLQPKIGLIPASVIFGFLHAGYGSMTEIFAATVLGIILGVLFQKRKNIYSPILAHLSFNFVMIISAMVIP